MSPTGADIPPSERVRAQAMLNALGRLAPVVEEAYERDWGPAWRKRLIAELRDGRAADLHDERQLLKAIAGTAPPMRLFPRHVPDDIRRLIQMAHAVSHNDGADWRSGTLLRLEATVISMLEAALPPTSLVVAAVRDGHIEAWRIRDQGIVEHRWWLERDGWSTWTAFPCPPARALAAASWGWGHMEVFVLDERNELHHRQWLLNDEHPGGRWFGWHPFPPGGRVLAPVSATSREEGHIELIARGIDGALVHCWRDASDGWREWHSLEDPR